MSDQEDSIWKKLKNRSSIAAVKALTPIVTNNKEQINKIVSEILDKVELIEGEVDANIVMWKTKDNQVKVGTITVNSQNKICRLVDSMQLHELLLTIVSQLHKIA